MRLLTTTVLFYNLIVAQSTQVPFLVQTNSSLVKFDPFHHLGPLSPYFEKGTSIDSEKKDDSCQVTGAIFLIRHSSLTGNDEDWESMKPIMDKLVLALDEIRSNSDYLNPLKNSKESGGILNFLNDWKPIIFEDSLEQITISGKQDSEMLGEKIRKEYTQLFSPENIKMQSRKQNRKKVKPIKVWSASSARDVTSAESFIKGAFGKMDSVELIKVDNKLEEWSKSLTPHKVCEKFDKIPSLIPANEYLSTFAGGIKNRLTPAFLEYGFSTTFVQELEDLDIIGLSMLCGSESAILSGRKKKRKLGEMDEISGFCNLFTTEDFINFENYFDIRYHYMVGYGNPISPYLGMPFLRNAAHLLKGDRKKDKHLDFSLPLPNSTHTQSIHFYFTHRESPPTLSTTLGLFNSSSGFWPENTNSPRLWKSSQIFPFLGHITIEKISCFDSKDLFVRVKVNGKVHPIPLCKQMDGSTREDGLCSFSNFEKFVKIREEEFGDFESACRVGA